jgi:methanogenesis imperfect marker protein 11
LEKNPLAELFTPDEIRTRFGGLPYVTPYERIVALVDEDAGLVELHEYHARGRCTGGAAWETHHYARTSPLVVSARREGARNIFVCKEGFSEVSLKPGIAGAGLEEVRVSDGEVALTYAGLGGGGVAATLCRGMAGNVLSTEIHEQGGGAALGRATLRLPAWRKLTVGVDDTDDADRGATWSTVNEIAFEIEQDGMADYLLHTIVQLFPENPYKTTNCCATAAVFGAPPGSLEGVVARAREMLATRTFSSECGIAWSTGVPVPAVLTEYAHAAQQGMVTIEAARSAASAAGASLAGVAGERGCIGALAAVGLHADPDAAVRLPGEGA